MNRPRASAADRAATWLLTGPVGRFVAFSGDFAAALWRTAKGDPRHPEERADPGAARSSRSS